MKAWMIETSTERGMLAYVEEGHVTFIKELPVGYNQSKTLMTELYLATQQLKIKPSDLNCIGVGIGPGSYTGIRIGVAVAKALAYAWKIPIVKFCTLEAFVPEEEGSFAAIIDAKIGGAYVLKGNASESQINYYTPPAVYPLDQLGTLLEDIPLLVTPYAKSIKPKIEQLYPDVPWHWREMSPSAKRMAAIVKERYDQKEWVLNHQLELLYLRKTEAERGKA